VFLFTVIGTGNKPIFGVYHREKLEISPFLDFSPVLVSTTFAVEM